MCGVVGYWPQKSHYNDIGVERILAFSELFRQSTVRGLHAFGLANPNIVYRSHSVEDTLDFFDPFLPTVAHARYCTSGDWKTMENNQPLVAGGRALVFNGVIHMGTKPEFEKEFGVQCTTDNDGEVFLRMLAKADETAEGDGTRSAHDDAEHILNVMDQQSHISFAGCWLDLQGRLWAARNERRPLWRASILDATWYASTRDIFLRAGFPEPTELQPGVELAS